VRTLLLALLLSIHNPALNPGPSSAKDNPFAETAKVRVLIFARTDCPITNRYAPELARIGEKFALQGVKFWVVYPDASETPAKIAQHTADYHLPGRGISDPHGELRKRSEANVSPQAAVFDGAGKLVYSGRIDDRFVAFGKSRPAPTVHDLENAIEATVEGKRVVESRTKAIGCYLDDLR
jgi:hypothetical protein